MREVGEKCGIFGIYGKGLDASRLTFFGLYALQHRGQESSGIASSDGRKIICYKNTGLAFTINGSKFMIGHFINALISFLLISEAIFFFVVKPVNMLVNRSKKEPSPTSKKCKECFSDVPLEARRCSHCTQVIN